MNSCCRVLFNVMPELLDLESETMNLLRRQLAEMSSASADGSVNLSISTFLSAFLTSNSKSICNRELDSETFGYETIFFELSSKLADGVLGVSSDLAPLSIELFDAVSPFSL